MAKLLIEPSTRGPKAPQHLTFITVILLLLILAHPVPAQKTTVTITAAPSIPSTAPEYTNETTFTSAILNSTNAYRAQHNATSMSWNATLASFAAAYLNSSAVGPDCTFAHSGGPYGENLAIGYANATAAVEAWGDEGNKYDFAHPGFSEATGHFTQLVWKDSSDVGCGRRLCGTKGWYLACEYWPRGNVVGAFQGEVDKSVNSAVTVRSAWLRFVTAGVVLWIAS
ncbi:CAP domain-containing protein [Hypoxylon argillaceum]|nr:CAP domain-containing protein [Hypoxylon argillaceum]